MAARRGSSSFKEPAVELRGLTKQFGPVLANAGVNLRVEAGTIHGLIGENGAGKTTAMNLLYGMMEPDAGEIFVRGEKCRWRSPGDAIASVLPDGAKATRVTEDTEPTTPCRSWPMS